MSFNPHQWYLNGLRKVGANNTFIGGVSSVINTPALLAAKLLNYPSGTAFSAANIQNFTIIGSDIECYIGVDYQIASVAFKDSALITSYEDFDGYCIALKSQSIRSNANITKLLFPKVTVIETFTLEALTSLQLANFESCTYFSTHSFTEVPSTCIITTNLTNLTNGIDGGPEARLRVANCIVNYPNYIDDGSWNTEIKGVSAIENSRLLAGRRIGCSPAALLNFQIVGSDIRFKVYGKYVVGAYAFSNRSDITDFKDNSNLVKLLDSAAFSYTPNFLFPIFNGITSLVANQQFRGGGLQVLTMNGLTTISGSYLARDTGSIITFSFPNLVNWASDTIFYSNLITNVYTPKLKTLGTNTGNSGAIGNTIRLNVGTITVDRFMETCNAGAPDGDLVYCRDTRGATIVYVDN